MPQVVDPLQPVQGRDYHTHKDAYVQGGYRTVDTLALRDAIPADHRKIGMRVYVVENDVEYRKQAPINDNGSSWEVVAANDALPPDPDSKPHTTPAAAIATIYVDAAGDDSNDGTVGLPIATIQEALRRVATAGETQTTISVGAGTFALPKLIPLANNVSIVGTETDGATATVVAVNNANVDDGLVLTAQGLGLASADGYQGTLIEWVDGAAAGTRGWIYRNDASVGANTTIYVTQDEVDALVTPGLLTQATIKVQATTLELQGETSVVDSSGLEIRQCTISGAYDLRHGGGDRVTYRDCRFDQALLTVEEGLVTVRCCYVATTGTDADGLLPVRNAGTLLLEQGAVLDGPLAAASAARHLTIKDLGVVRIRGQVVVRGLVGGILLTNGGLIPEDAGNSWHSVLFEDALGTTKDNLVGITVGGTVIHGGLPHLHGEVAADYIVTANGTADGLIRLPTSSTLRGALGLRPVSADAGASNATEDGHTRIVGGSVDVRRLMPGTHQTGTIGTDTERWATVYAEEVHMGDMVMRDPAGRSVYRWSEGPPGELYVDEEMSGQLFRVPLVPRISATLSRRGRAARYLLRRLLGVQRLSDLL